MNPRKKHHHHHQHHHHHHGGPEFQHPGPGPPKSRHHGKKSTHISGPSCGSLGHPPLTISGIPVPAEQDRTQPGHPHHKDTLSGRIRSLLSGHAPWKHLCVGAFASGHLTCFQRGEGRNKFAVDSRSVVKPPLLGETLFFTTLQNNDHKGE